MALGALKKPRSGLKPRPKRKPKISKPVPEWHAPLLASKDSLRLQNEAADNYGIERMQSPDSIGKFYKAGLLVKISRDAAYYYADSKEISDGYLYLRPYAREFLELLSEKYFKNFSKKLRLTGLIRDPPRQAAIVGLRQSIASGASLFSRSAHLTGAAMDISRLGMALAEISWMRRELVQWKKADAVEAIEELSGNTNCFHIFVLPDFRKKNPRE
ncbi:hypothetical protein HYT01_02600 [Candidatus Giovannonibacteria bacterium]|nr:hypothetical protein [Candidatus Giovannonibacteria bacterium]